MTEQKDDLETQEELRREAERRLQGALEDEEDVSLNEDTPLTELLHELQVHQIELEIQNERLRESQSRLQRSQEKYEDLYDFAPVSYLTLKESGEVVRANLTAADKLQLDRDELIGEKIYKFMAEEDKDVLFKALRRGFKSGESETCELRFRRPGSTTSGKGSEETAAGFYGLLEISFYEGGTGESHCLAALNDITTRKKAEEKIERSEERLRDSFIDLAETTSRALGVRDPYTQKHEQRVAELSREVGRRLGLDEEEKFGLYLGGILHDIGKIVIPENILTKPGELKEVEWNLIKSHPEVGYNQILEDTDFPWPMAEMTLHHHERLDGSGYPDGLEGEELSLEVRILGVVDVVEAMSSRRPYRGARSKERTLEVIKNGKGEKFDPEVVDVLVELIECGEIEFGSGFSSL